MYLCKYIWAVWYIRVGVKEAASLTPWRLNHQQVTLDILLFKMQMQLFEVFMYIVQLKSIWVVVNSVNQPHLLPGASITNR